MHVCIFCLAVNESILKSPPCKKEIFKKKRGLCWSIPSLFVSLAHGLTTGLQSFFRRDRLSVGVCVNASRWQIFIKSEYFEGHGAGVRLKT